MVCKTNVIQIVGKRDPASRPLMLFQDSVRPNVFAKEPYRSRILTFGNILLTGVAYS